MDDGIIQRMLADIPNVAPFSRTLLSNLRLVYSIRNGGQFKPLGSGLLLKVDSTYFLVTAAHVLDENQSDETGSLDLVTYGNTKALYLKGRSYRSSKINHSRKADKTDIGFIELSSTDVDQIGADRFLIPADLDSDDPGGNSLFFALGYPANKNGVKRGSPIIKPNAMCYSATLSEKGYDVVGVTSSTHLLLNFDKKRSWNNSTRERCQPPDPVGMSGGGLWRYKAYNTNPKEDVVCPKLVGVLIEWHKKQNKYLLAARVSLLFEAMRFAYPNLDHALPKTGLAYISVTAG